MIYFPVLHGNAQPAPDSILKYIYSEKQELSLHYPEELAAFYKNYQYRYAWINGSKNLEELNSLFLRAPELGLNEKDYDGETGVMMESAKGLTTQRDSIIKDIVATDAAIHFLHDLAFGSSPPDLGYIGLEPFDHCVNIPQILSKALNDNHIGGLILDVEPHADGYKSLKRWLSVFNSQIGDSGYREIFIRSSEVSQNNRELIARLHQLGIMALTDRVYSNSELEEKVRESQRLFNLKEEGRLNAATREAMNVPLAFRVEEVKSALNTLRWLRCLDGYPGMILVNIPSANLLVYHGGNLVMQSRVVVGKRTTRTPSLASSITDLILYPYWVVPKKIATRELLPSIKRNIRFIDDNNLQILDQKGRVIDPAKINWKSLSAANFPYELRQSTGCDNSLGLIKFNFYSPYGVYLHDTPMKNLFHANRRYFSHGCIRVEKAMDLARFLLNGNTTKMDRILEKGCLPNQPPISIPLRVKVPVFVLYHTAWFDSSANLQFNQDIYKKLDKAGR
jgi:murein L,D-transpeptidase YcbB/YkuD